MCKGRSHEILINRLLNVTEAVCYSRKTSVLTNLIVLCLRLIDYIPAISETRKHELNIVLDNMHPEL